jgi:hypothetical protein
MSWHLCFDEPITLEDGTELASLRDAIAYLAQSIPETEHLVKEVQAAAHCVTQAAENGGPLLFARIGMMQAINRHKPRVIRHGKSRIGAGASSSGTSLRRRKRRKANSYADGIFAWPTTRAGRVGDAPRSDRRLWRHQSNRS